MGVLKIKDLRDGFIKYECYDNMTILVNNINILTFIICKNSLNIKTLNPI